jgi:serine/threonine-protein kinase RsbT
MLPLAEKIQHLSLRNAFDVDIARATVRKLAGSRGYSLLDQVRISTAIYEIARDLIAYAGRGEITISWREDNPKYRGLVFSCNDCGLSDPTLTAKLQTGGYNSNNKLNFLSMRKLVDEFEFAMDPERGNCVTVVKWI